MNLIPFEYQEFLRTKVLFLKECFPSHWLIDDSKFIVVADISKSKYNLECLYACYILKCVCL